MELMDFIEARSSYPPQYLSNAYNGKGAIYFDLVVADSSAQALCIPLTLVHALRFRPTADRTVFVP